MPRKIKPLSDTKIRTAKPREKDYKLFDGDGLFLLVTSTGGKLWRLKYRFGGREKLLALGAYPQLALGDARQKRDEKRKLISNGSDPAEIQKAQKSSTGDSDANSFEVVAREWHGRFKQTWSDKHAQITLRRLELNIFPFIGKRPVGEIEPKEVLDVLRRMEAKGILESARRMKIICGQVFRYAVQTGRARLDPTADLRGAMAPPIKQHMASFTDPKDVAALMRAIWDYKSSIVVKSALKLAALFFLRPGELRKLEWADVDLDKLEIHIPIDRMKLTKKSKAERKGQTHIVPLSHQAVEILMELQPLTGHSAYVFPSMRTNLRPMSDNAVLSALRRMGFAKDEMSGHGFRAMARTILDQVLKVRTDYIEHQLAHAVKDPNGRAYNRTTHLEERRIMMQKWADYLDSLRNGEATT